MVYLAGFLRSGSRGHFAFGANSTFFIQKGSRVSVGGRCDAARSGGVCTRRGRTTKGVSCADCSARATRPRRTKSSAASAVIGTAIGTCHPESASVAGWARAGSTGADHSAFKPRAGAGRLLEHETPGRGRFADGEGDGLRATQSA